MVNVVYPAPAAAVHGELTAGNLPAVGAWLRTLDDGRRALIRTNPAQCPFVSAEASAAVAIALAAAQDDVASLVLEHMGARGLHMTAKFGAAALEILSGRSPAAPLEALRRQLVERIAPEDRAFIAELCSTRGAMEPAVVALRSAGWLPSLTPLQQVYDASLKHFYYDNVRPLTTRGLIGRIAAEWAGVAAASRDRRHAEIFAVLTASFEPVLLAMVRNTCFTMLTFSC